MRCPEIYPSGAQCSQDEGHEGQHTLSDDAFCLKKCDEGCHICALHVAHPGEHHMLDGGGLLFLVMKLANTFILDGPDTSTEVH
jgi:hypothetical protein